jgi:uncharacterized protein
MIATLLTRFAFGLLLVLGTSLAADRASAQGRAAQPSANSIALAKEVIVIKGAHQMFNAIVPGVIERAKNLFLPTNPNLNKELTEVGARLKAEYSAKADELLNEVAKTYASHFTEQELKEILAFYKTALGKKLLAEDPVAIEAGMKRANDWADDFSNQVIARMRAEMKKKGYDL